MVTIREARLAAIQGTLLVLFAFAVGCVDRSPVVPVGVPEPRPAVLARTRMQLARVYFHVQLWWVTTGDYPEELRDLLSAPPGAPFSALSTGEIADPFSMHGLPFRYRVSERGPELASVGPDARWGGWQDERQTFFGLDDIVFRSDAEARLTVEFLHAAYSEAVATGAVQSPVVLVQVPDGQSRSVEGTLRGWRPRQSFAVSSVADLLKRLQAEPMVNLAIDENQLSPRNTGLGTWSAVKVGTYQQALSLLQEAAPGVIEVLAWEAPSMTLFHLDAGEAGEVAFWQLVAQGGDADLRRHLDQAAGFPDDVPLVFPEESLDEAALGHMKVLLRSLFGPEWEGLYKTRVGIVVTGFPSWCDVYFMLDRFRDFVPDPATTRRVHKEIERQNQRR